MPALRSVASGIIAHMTMRQPNCTWKLNPTRKKREKTLIAFASLALSCCTTAISTRHFNHILNIQVTILLIIMMMPTASMFLWHAMSFEDVYVARLDY